MFPFLFVNPRKGFVSRMAEKENGERKPRSRKGIPNKVSAKAKDAIITLLTDYSDSGLMARDFASLDPKERLLVYEKLLNYARPKLQAVTAEVTTTEMEKRITEQLAEMVNENE